MTGPFRQTGVYVVFLIFISTAVSQIPPGSPVITGPSLFIEGQQYTLTCTVQGGNPAPSVRWLRDNQVIDEILESSTGNTYVNEYRFTATNNEHLEVFECQSENGVLQNPLSTTKFVEVSKTPNVPVLTGPTTIVPGTSRTWTCTSVGGYPAQTMQMRIENNAFTSNQFVINTRYNTTRKEYDVSGVLTWAPTTANNGQRLYCDVSHPQTLGNNRQTASLPLTVQAQLIVDAPITVYNPSVGQTLSINCVVTSGTATSISWTKNNQPVILANDARLSGGTPNSPSLVINGVQTADAGSYQCQASDGSSVVSTNVINVNIQVPIRVNAPVTSYTPTTGNTVTLNCVVTQGTPTQITWYKFSQPITISANQRLSGGTVTSPGLTITNVQTSDAGTYECEATNGVSTARTNAITLSPVPPLQLNAPQTFYNPSTGDTIVLNCVVTSGTATSIRWYKNTQQIVMFANPRYSGGNQNTPPLTITNVQTSDAGSYECEGSDAFTTVKTNVITVSVRVPLAITADQYQYTPTEGDTLVINCRVTSGTPTAVNWYKGSQLIVKANDARLSGGTTANPSLTITSVRMTDVGSYACEATDGTQSVRTNTITVSPVERTVTEQDIITSILNGYNKLVRPTPSPNIEHSMHPTRIVQCEPESLVLQGWTCMYWTDSRLSWPRGQESVSLPSSEIWLPDITQEAEKPDFYTAPIWAAEKVVVTKQGRVGFCPQGIFTTKKCSEKAGEKHECTMKFRSWSYDKDLVDINLPTNREAVDISGLAAHSECEIVNKCAVRAERTYACCGNRLYPDITYTLVWQRKRNYCVNLSEQPTCNA